MFLLIFLSLWRHEVVKGQTNNKTLWPTASINTLLFEPTPLLDEAHEGSDSRPRANHDHWDGGFEGQAELRLADVHRNSGLVAVVSDQFVLQPVRGHSLVDAASFGLILYHHGTNVDAVRVNLQNRGELLIDYSTLTLRTDFCMSLLPRQYPYQNIFPKMIKPLVW